MNIIDQIYIDNFNKYFTSINETCYIECINNGIIPLIKNDNELNHLIHILPKWFNPSKYEIPDREKTKVIKGFGLWSNVDPYAFMLKHKDSIYGICKQYPL